METIKLTSQQFLDLPTYSVSNPTGIVIGKQWKRETDSVWYLCEYVACDAPGYVDIVRKKIEIENVKPANNASTRPPFGVGMRARLGNWLAHIGNRIARNGGG